MRVVVSSLVLLAVLLAGSTFYQWNVSQDLRAELEEVRQLALDAEQRALLLNNDQVEISGEVNAATWEFGYQILDMDTRIDVLDVRFIDTEACLRSIVNVLTVGAGELSFTCP